MNTRVHILVTCLNANRLKSALLVFETLRVGFPSAQVFVYANGLDNVLQHVLSTCCEKTQCHFTHIPLHSHGEWIEKLLESQPDAFWICDSDIVLFDKMEHWFSQSDDLFSGRYEPEFFEPWTKTTHVARLHPSLMWFNPQPLRAAMRGWPAKHEFFNSVESNMIRWHWVPSRVNGTSKLLFYDTCAGLHHALKGTEFTDKQNEAFAHLFCGTYADLIAEHTDLLQLHESVFEKPELARDLWPAQKKWYSEHRNEPCHP